MSFLTGLSNVAVGAQQGVQGFQAIQQRAQQIQQAQQALDMAKKQTAADAAAFSGIGMDGGVGGGGMAPQPGPYPAGLPGAQALPGQQVQPMAPGQPSMPSQPPQGGAMPPQQGSQPATPPPAGGMTAPAPQQGAGGSLPGQQQPQPGQDVADPMGGVKAVMQIAKEIKTRNPNIDPQTLMLATQRVIDLSKGMAPALRQQAQVVVQQMRDQTSRANTQDRVDTQQRGQDMGAQNVQARIGSNEKIASGHDAASLQRVQQQGAQAMARTQASIAAANQRQQNGQWSKEKRDAYADRVRMVSAKLRTATSRISALTAAGVAPTDPRAVQAGKEVQDALGEMDRVDAAAKVTPSGGAPGASGAAPADTAPKRGPAPAMLHGKPIYPENGKWVFEDGTEAK